MCQMKAGDIVKIIKAAAESGVRSLKIGDLQVVFDHSSEPIKPAKLPLERKPVVPSLDPQSTVERAAARSKKEESSPSAVDDDNDEAAIKLEMLMYDDFEAFELMNIAEMMPD